MTDVHSKEIRSYNMSQIKGKDTKPEMIVRQFLFSRGLRYRLHDKKLKGSPDIVLTKYRTVVFIHGCFWHGHENCKQFVLPKTRTDWWKRKIFSTKVKDLEDLKALEDEGWKVIIVWSCELTPRNREQTMKQLVKNIQMKINPSQKL